MFFTFSIFHRVVKIFFFILEHWNLIWSDETWTGGRLNGNLKSSEIKLALFRPSKAIAWNDYYFFCRFRTRTHSHNEQFSFSQFSLFSFSHENCSQTIVYSSSSLFWWMGSRRSELRRGQGEVKLGKKEISYSQLFTHNGETNFHHSGENSSEKW